MRGRLWAVLFGLLALLCAATAGWAVYGQLSADMATAEPIILLVGAMSAGVMAGTFGALAYISWVEA